jgi:Transposase zinc-binding domain
MYGAPFLLFHSPLEKTPHKARNGELTITCRNRHCPKCQTQARERWLAARERELLATSYFHVVFTVPHELNVLALENPRLFYDLLFTARMIVAGSAHAILSSYP